MSETENGVVQAVVPRTSAGLRGALFDELDSLRGGKSNASKANATAKLALAIVSTVEMELEVHRQMNKLPKGGEQIPATLPPLALAANA